MNCNTTQKEVGGKDLLLKACEAISVTSTSPGTPTIFTLVSPPSGFELKAGDLIAFLTRGTNTTFNISTLAAPKFYKILTVPSLTTFTFADLATPTVAISADDAEVGMSALAFVGVGGLRSKTFSVKVDGIDITNSDSDQWTTLLDGAGIRSFELSGEGVFTNSQKVQALEDALIANRQVCLMFLDAKAYRIYEGCFKITSMEYSGSFDGEGTFSMSASSSGALTVVPAA